MDISRISYQPLPADTLPSRTGKGSTSGASGEDSSSPVRSGSQASATQEPHNLSRVDYIKKALDDILVNFPPWFPAGAPQRVDLIRKIRDVQGQIGSSPAADETVKRLASGTLSDGASDKEIAAVMEGLRGFKEALTQRNAPTPGSGKSGNLVNIKV